MILDRSVPTLINIPFGWVAKFFAKIATGLLVVMCGREVTILGTGRTARFCIELGCCAMLLSPAQLVLTDLDASLLGSIATHFATVDSGVHALLSCQSPLMV